jgi:hypothetical protein
MEAGTIEGTDPSLKERVAGIARDRAVEASDYARKSSALPVQIDPVAIDRFTRLMRLQLVSGRRRGPQSLPRQHPQCGDRVGEQNPNHWCVAAPNIDAPYCLT